MAGPSLAVFGLHLGAVFTVTLLMALSFFSFLSRVLGDCLEQLVSLE